MSERDTQRIRRLEAEIATLKLRVDSIEREVRLPTVNDETRPKAGKTGRLVFNMTDAQINVDDGTDWTLPDGSTT